MKKDRFTKKVFKEVNRLYWEEGYDQYDIAEVFKCNQGSISRIINGLFTPVEERRAVKKQKYSPNYKPSPYEPGSAKTLRCKRETLHNTKLNVTKAKEIRRAYFAGEKNQCELAKLNNINQSNISRIIAGDKWKICKC